MVSKGITWTSASGIARRSGLSICYRAHSIRGALSLQTRRFLKNFIRRPGETGAIVASSRELANVITDVAQLGGAEVVVEGRLVTAGDGARFQADKVLAKCPSKFEGVEPTRAALN